MVAASTDLFVRCKKNNELYSLLACHVAIILWLYFSMIEQLSSTVPEEMFRVRFTLVPIMIIGALWFIFILYWAEIITPKNRRKVITAIVLPLLLCMWPLVTEKYFKLILVSKTLGGGHDVWGIFFNIDIAISYSYVVASIIIVIWKSHKRKDNKMISVLLISAILCPGIMNIITGLKFFRIPGFDLTPLTLSLYCIIISIYIHRYRFIEIIPVAAYELFATLNEAVFITDNKGKIIDRNPYCEEYFGELFNIKKCGSIQDFLGQLNDFTLDKKIVSQMVEYIIGNQTNEQENNIRIISPSQDEKQYTLSVLPLKSGKRQKLIGRLVIFKDVTEYRILTITGERNRMSDNLHDSMGNSINVITSNLEYALKNFGDEPEVKECISKSYERANGALRDLRRIVDELRPIDIENNGLIWALKSLFKKLSVGNKNINFAYDAIDDLNPAMLKQAETIYAICQEAVNNSFNHGKANNVDVTLKHTDGFLKLYIMDDGEGCDKIVKNKGLNSMEMRVTALDGEISYGSMNNEGFFIRVALPFKN